MVQGGLLSLAAAENTAAVPAVAVYEPSVFEVISEEESHALEKGSHVWASWPLRTG